MEPTQTMEDAADLMGRGASNVAFPLEAAGLRLGLPLDGSQRLKYYATWFIRLRWIAAFVAGEVVLLSVVIAELLPRSVLAPLLITLAVLVMLNVAYGLFVRTRSIRPIHLALQAYVDIAILAVLLHFSGGVENPLAMIMSFHVIIAGIMLSKWHCLRLAASAAILFALVAGLELYGVIEHYGLELFPHSASPTGLHLHAAHDALYVGGVVSTHCVVLLLTAFFVSWLSDQLRRRERELEAMRERAVGERRLLEQSLETTGTALCVCDDQLNPVFTNGRWEKWFGGGPDNQAFTNLISEPDSPLLKTRRDGLLRVTEVAAPAPRESRDTRRIYQATTAALAPQDGQAMRLVHLVQDVTAQKALQARVLRAGQLAAVGELAGQVAHEVNNPIAIIIAKARLLIDDHKNELSAEAVSELTKIESLGNRVAVIARKLLSTSRPFSEERGRIDVSDVVQYAVAMIEDPAARIGIRIADRLPKAPIRISGFRCEMEQVFLNLLLNALDAMPDGGLLTVSATEDEHSGKVDIAVADTGVGIPPSLLERVFEPFFTTKPGTHGTGLGLTICTGLIRNHGGTTRVESQPGVGTTVTVSLPLDERETTL